MSLWPFFLSLFSSFTLYLLSFPPFHLFSYPSQPTFPAVSHVISPSPVVRPVTLLSQCALCSVWHGGMQLYRIKHACPCHLFCCIWNLLCQLSIWEKHLSCFLDLSLPSHIYSVRKLSLIWSFFFFLLQKTNLNRLKKNYYCNIITIVKTLLMWVAISASFHSNLTLSLSLST